MLVIGISGITNGGKSNLVKNLMGTLPHRTILLTQDDYFYPEDSPHHVPSPGGIPHHNWDIITSLDMDKMVNDIISHRKEENGVLLLDGFILYDDPRVTKLCDLRFFITLDREECKRRRDTREYDPPDIPGYFDACVWPMYEEHLRKVQKLTEHITFLDGKSPPEKNSTIVREKILEIIPQNF